MKKILCLILVLILSLSLVACSKGGVATMDLIKGEKRFDNTTAQDIVLTCLILAPLDTDYLDEYHDITVNTKNFVVTELSSDTVGLTPKDKYEPRVTPPYSYTIELGSPDLYQSYINDYPDNKVVDNVTYYYNETKLLAVIPADELETARSSVFVTTQKDSNSENWPSYAIDDIEKILKGITNGTYQKEERPSTISEMDGLKIGFDFSWNSQNTISTWSEKWSHIDVSAPEADINQFISISLINTENNQFFTDMFKNECEVLSDTSGKKIGYTKVEYDMNNYYVQQGENLYFQFMTSEDVDWAAVESLLNYKK